MCAACSLFRLSCVPYPQDYIQVNVGSTELRANPNITQIIEVVEEHDKRNRLFAVLRTIPVGDRCIIFCETKKGCDDLCRQMRTNGIPALAIHGDKEQRERDWVRGRCRFSPPLPLHTYHAQMYCLVGDRGYVSRC